MPTRRSLGMGRGAGSGWRCVGWLAVIPGAAAGTIRCPRARVASAMMDQKNLLLAIVISVAILFAFQYVFERTKPPAPPAPAQQETPTTAPAPGAIPPPGSAAAPSAAPAAPVETREA